jgi:hypothetical protein
MSLAHIDRVRRQPVSYALGVPRYMFGTAARSLLFIVSRGWRADANPEKVFTSELSLWDLMGFMYGKYFRPAPKASTTPAPSSPPAAAGGAKA